MNKVAITGYGVVTPFGIGVNTMMEGIKNDTYCFTEQEVIVRDNSKPVILPTGRVPFPMDILDEYPNSIARYMTPMSLFLHLAYKEARDMAYLTDKDMSNAGVYVASTLPHIHTGKTQLVSDIFKTFTNNPAFILAQLINCANRVITPCAACSTSLQAVNMAAEDIANGKIDIAICGATEEWSNELAKIFVKLDIASKTSCRPFEYDRDGTVISEGAGILILESEEHAKNRLVKTLGYIAGTGHSFSANISVPTEDSITKCMLDAYTPFYFNQREGTSGEVLICAHATGTPTGDAIEKAAIEKFRIRLKSMHKTVSYSTYKQYLGHTMAASGVIELIASLVKEPFFPTINNAFGLGGVNASTLVINNEWFYRD